MASVVKVEKEVLEKVPTLNTMEMLRILDARNADVGLKKMLLTSDSSCTAEGLERLLLDLTDSNGCGPAQRFRDYCEKLCVNRRLIL